MSVSSADTPTVGLGQFIRESRFVVPTHQRDYSWTDEVTVFLHDIEEAKKNPSDIYFCGLMVFTAASVPLLKVLDGQQRLATTLMIFSAIRNWLFRTPDFRDDATKISTQLLTRDDIGSKPEPKLILTPVNNDTFQKFVINNSHISEIEAASKKTDKQDRNKKLLLAAVAINQHIEKKAAKFSSPKEARDYFVELITYIGSTVKVVRFVLGGDEAAYTIFETLNDRGLELAPLDLVKNYLFSRAERFRKGALVEFEDRWSQMMTLLGSEAADSFLKAFWASRHGALEGPKLFAKFKETYSTPEAAHEISLDLRRGAENYAAIFSPTDAVWADYSFQARQRVNGLSIIGASQLYPIMLAALEKFERQEMEKLLRLLEAIAVRYQLIIRGRPGRIESLGGRAARDIWSSKIKKTSEVLTALGELSVSDEDFKRRFVIHSEKNGKKARYILASLERQSLQKEGKTYRDELVPGDITLEHVFPKSPKEFWAAELQNDPRLSGMTNRLGNLCLLTDVNRALGNKGWPEKLAVFDRSRLHITSTIDSATYPKWGSAAIEQRQVWMADLAVAAWRYP
jgi:hypothetical protein